jgi:hypothetical protein
MRIVNFDGLGRPKATGIEDGSVLILVQGDEVSVVRVELLPPEKFGPALEHALNDAELVDEARRAVRAAFPAWLSAERHWTLEAPAELAARARFPRRG